MTKENKLCVDAFRYIYLLCEVVSLVYVRVETDYEI